jgi:hypothetical protein
MQIHNLAADIYDVHKRDILYDAHPSIPISMMRTLPALFVKL